MISLLAQVLLTANALRRAAKVAHEKLPGFPLLGNSLEDHANDLERTALAEDKK